MTLPGRPIACSTAYDEVSAWGSATRASFWVALEQPGPWGREALTQSDLDAELGARLSEVSLAAGGRVLLIRSPGEHVDRTGFQSRRMYVAGGLGGTPWLLTGAVLDPADLERLPWERLCDTTPDAVLEACPWLHVQSEPVLLVCANSKRDVCCARLGRPVALGMAARHPGQVWECSHTGGHRFAATGLILPLGQMLARLDLDLGDAILDAAASGLFAMGTLNERHDRGVSHLQPAEQAALSWVRATEGITDPRALASVGGVDSVTVQHVDGRVWDLAVTATTGADLPDSCGKPAKPATSWTVQHLR